MTNLNGAVISNVLKFPKKKLRSKATISAPVEDGSDLLKALIKSVQKVSPERFISETLEKELSLVNPSRIYKK